MSHLRTPLCQSSTIFLRMGSGSGRPFKKTPPSRFTPSRSLDPFPISEAVSIACASELAERNNCRGSSVDGPRSRSIPLALSFPRAYVSAFRDQ